MSLINGDNGWRQRWYRTNAKKVIIEGPYSVYKWNSYWKIRNWFSTLNQMNIKGRIIAVRQKHQGTWSCYRSRNHWLTTLPSGLSFQLSILSEGKSPDGVASVGLLTEEFTLQDRRIVAKTQNTNWRRNNRNRQTNNYWTWNTWFTSWIDQVGWKWNYVHHMGQNFCQHSREVANLCGDHGLQNWS